MASPNFIIAAIISLSVINIYIGCNDFLTHQNQKRTKTATIINYTLIGGGFLAIIVTTSFLIMQN